MLDPVVRGALFDLVAREEKPALVIVIRHAVRPPHKDLFDARQGGSGLFAEHIDIDRHFAPAEEKETALVDDVVGDGLGARLRIGVVVRQEDHADAEVGFLEKAMPELLHFGRKKFVGNLGRDARAVAGLRIRIDGPAMGEIAERLERVFQHLIRSLAADLGDEAHAAGIMFKIRRVERLAALHVVQNDLVQHKLEYSLDISQPTKLGAKTDNSRPNLLQIDKFLSPTALVNHCLCLDSALSLIRTPLLTHWYERTR